MKPQNTRLKPELLILPNTIFNFISGKNNSPIEDID